MPAPAGGFVALARCARSDKALPSGAINQSARRLVFAADVGRPLNFFFFFFFVLHETLSSAAGAKNLGATLARHARSGRRDLHRGGAERASFPARMAGGMRARARRVT